MANRRLCVRPRPPRGVPGALVVGLSAAWFALRRSAAPKSRWVPVALLTITAITPLLGWQARNAVLADYGGLSAIVDVNGRAIQSSARGRQRNGSTSWDARDWHGSSDYPWVYGAIHLRGMARVAVDREVWSICAFSVHIRPTAVCSGVSSTKVFGRRSNTCYNSVRVWCL